MAQRISRAKRTLRGRRLDQPGDLAVVLRVLYLVYTAGHAGRVDLAGEAIRLARQLTLATEEPEARGLLALMLLNHARLPARLDAEGRIVTLDRQDRGLWDTREIAEGVRVLQSALAMQTSAPGPLPDRGRDRRPARRRGERRGDRLAADPRLVRRPRRADRRPRAPGPRRGARPRGRGRPRPRRRRRAARDRPAARRDRRAAPLARRARAPARARRRPARRRHGVRRGRPPGHERRRARPPRPPGRPGAASYVRRSGSGKPPRHRRLRWDRRQRGGSRKPGPRRHASHIYDELGIDRRASDHRRVLAVVRYLSA